MFIAMMEVDQGNFENGIQRLSCIMPRNSCVTVPKAVEAIEANIDHFRTNAFPKSTDKLWREMSEHCCNKKWKPLTWYANVTEDRREILTIARRNKNVNVPASQPAPTIDETLNASRDERSYQEETNSEVDENATTFTLTLTPADQRTTHTLRPHVWTNVISDLFYQEHRLPCAFTFKRGDVYTSHDRKHFIKIVGYCLDEKCANRFVGIAVHVMARRGEWSGGQL
ncbi:uncharacterized protein LOC135160004 [Diachasmimorpha longicaudata]|uniref:uncharacterized protein LOC135160004 n=1 Tax=Diachasmimorpha longicaudata TaxID=58733 RepID=UPI0030B8F488